MIRYLIYSTAVTFCLVANAMASYPHDPEQISPLAMVAPGVMQRIASFLTPAEAGQFALTCTRHKTAVEAAWKYIKINQMKFEPSLSIRSTILGRQAYMRGKVAQLEVDRASTSKFRYEKGLRHGKAEDLREYEKKYLAADLYEQEQRKEMSYQDQLACSYGDPFALLNRQDFEDEKPVRKPDQVNLYMHSWAARGHMTCLLYLRNFYSVLPGEGTEEQRRPCREINDRLIALGSLDAINFKRGSFLIRGFYEITQEEYVQLTDELCQKGHPEAFKDKVLNLLLGENGYAKDLDSVKALLWNDALLNKAGKFSKALKKGVDPEHWMNNFFRNMLYNLSLSRSDGNVNRLINDFKADKLMIDKYRWIKFKALLLGLPPYERNVEAAKVYVKDIHLDYLSIVHGQMARISEMETSEKEQCLAYLNLKIQEAKQQKPAKPDVFRHTLQSKSFLDCIEAAQVLGQSLASAIEMLPQIKDLQTLALGWSKLRSFSYSRNSNIEIFETRLRECVATYDEISHVFNLLQASSSVATAYAFALLKDYVPDEDAYT